MINLGFWFTLWIFWLWIAKWNTCLWAHCWNNISNSTTSGVRVIRVCIDSFFTNNTNPFFIKGRHAIWGELRGIKKYSCYITNKSRRRFSVHPIRMNPIGSRWLGIWECTTKQSNWDQLLRLLSTKTRFTLLISVVITRPQISWTHSSVVSQPKMVYYHTIYVPVTRISVMEKIIYWIS